MPDASGRIPPVAVPRVPWCLRCKLVACACPPALAQPTSRPPGYVGHVFVHPARVTELLRNGRRT